MAIIFLTCIFDAFSIRRRINAGEIVPDGIEDILGVLRRNKILTLIAAGILLLGLSGRLLSIVLNVGGFVFVAIFILLGLYVIFKRRPPQE